MVVCDGDFLRGLSPLPKPQSGPTFWRDFTMLRANGLIRAALVILLHSLSRPCTNIVVGYSELTITLFQRPIGSRRGFATSVELNEVVIVSAVATPVQNALRPFVSADLVLDRFALRSRTSRGVSLACRHPNSAPSQSPKPVTEQAIAFRNESLSSTFFRHRLLPQLWKGAECSCLESLLKLRDRGR